MPPAPPTGTVTFLFTDIEGSTRLWQADRLGMEAALARHHALLQAAIGEQGGYVFQIIGDAFCAAFSTPAAALAAALAAQRGLRDEAWGAAPPIRVRMALHTGVTQLKPDDYTSGEYRSGLTLSRAARLLAAAHGGQVILSHVTAELAGEQIGPGLSLRDLGEHQLKDLAHPEHIYQAVAPDLPADFPPLRTLDRVAHNLPIQLTHFVGRERELGEVRALVSAERLVTLIGPGGTGKTRLAIGVAADLSALFGDGVWLVELAPLSDPALVTQTVASALDVRERAGRPLSAVLADSLRPRELLLVLDNCEHLVAACAELAEGLLRACPHLHILATSREVLNIPGEKVWPVPSLSLPQRLPPRAALADLLHYEAIRLFTERATAASPAFALTEQNAAAVADICQRLDGMPLAIELAAARVRALPVEQIAARLATSDRFRLLASGSRTAPARQQTLAATLDWSYALLPEAERTVLQRLGVFAGGWSLEAAEAVCANTKDEGGRKKDEKDIHPSSFSLHPSDVLFLLSSLVDKSLVRVDGAGGTARYRLLETIRQYALGKLAEHGDEDRLRERHLDYCLRWAEGAEPQLIGPDQVAWLQRFEAEHDNLRTALDWSQRPGSDPKRALRLAAACGRFWRLHGYVGEGRSRLAAILSMPQPDAAHSPERAQALSYAAYLAYLQSDYPATRVYAEESLAIWKALGPAGRAGVAISLNRLGQLATEEGDYVAAPALLAESLAIWRELGNRYGIGDGLMQLGWAAMRTGDYARAVSQLEEALALLRQGGHLMNVAACLSGLGEAAIRLAQYERATRLLEESLTLRRTLGDQWGIDTALGSLGWVALRQGDYPRMRALLGESLSVRKEAGDRGGTAWCLEKLAEAALLQAQASGSDTAAHAEYRRAAHTFAAAAALRAPIGSVIDPADQPDYERLLSTLRAALGEAGFAAAWAEGQALTLDQAVSQSLAA